MGGRHGAAKGESLPRLPFAVVLALAAGTYGRAHPGWGCALLASASWALWPELSTRLGRLTALGLLGALAAAGWAASRPLAPTELPLNQGLRFRALVVEDPARTRVGMRLIAEVSGVSSSHPGPWRPAKGRIVLQVEGFPDPPPGRGDVTIFRGQLRPPWGLRNPGSHGYSDYLSRREVEARAFVRWPGEVVFAAPGRGAPAWLRWRRQEARALAEAVPGQAGAVLAALTLGDWSRILPETSESFRRAGTTHLLSISGLHLGIVALLVLPWIRWVLLRVPVLALAFPVEPVARLLVLPFLATYAMLAGLQASTMRSLTMAALLVAGSALSRPVSALGGLTSAVAVLAVWNPPVLADPGLQLSAAALAGLFWLAPRLEACLLKGERPPDPLAPPRGPARKWFASLGVWVRRLSVAGVAASLATAPIAAFHFGSSSLLGLALNPVAVPLVEFLCLPSALAGTALHSFWPRAGEVLWRLSGWGLDLLLRAQAALAPTAPMLASPVLATPVGCVGALVLLAGAGVALQRPIALRRALPLLLAGGSALLVPAALDWALERLDNDVHLWALDVGQGQALVLKIPPDRWILVDAGGFPGSELDTGEKVVIPALQALGARRLWLAVSTHPHPDHALGLASAVRLGRPERLWLPGSFEGDPRYLPALDAAHAAGTEVEWLGPAGTVRRERIGAARLEAVSVRGPTENDRSLVLRLVSGAATAVLPADVEASGQAALLDEGFRPGCDLLLAPHHGSTNAVYEPFLQGARPSTVFVSAAGRSSLPSREFFAAVRPLGCALFGTYEAGALHAILGQRGLSAGPLDPPSRILRSVGEADSTQ